MKQLFGFVVLYGILGAAAWVVIDARHEGGPSFLDASASPVPLHDRTSQDAETVSMSPRLLSLASPVVPLPAPAPMTPWLGDIGTDLNSEFRCLALNVYWEARSESSLGQFAVAAVTLNRVASERFPGTICDVVQQGGADRKHRCQFSWWCDGKRDNPTNEAAWQAAKSIAYTALFFDPPDPTNGALWYHADYVSPAWRSAMAHTATIGRHIYYRKPGRARARAIAYRD